MKALPSAADRFTTVYEATYPDLLRYLQRRSPDDAEDLAAEVFTVAWRRVDLLPKRLDDARAWLFGIGRNCLLNSRRGAGRQDALAVRMASHLRHDDTGEADWAVARMDLARAWDALDAADQEAIALAVLDGLSSAHAAYVLGISPVAFRHRLSRARKRLRVGMEQPALSRRPDGPRALYPAVSSPEELR